jgi:hypothetical protein
MDNTDAALIGVIVAMATIIGKIAEKLVDRFVKEKEDRSSEPHPDISKLLDWHDVKDPDGVFVWYFPRHALEKRFDEIMELLREIRDRQFQIKADIIEEIRKRK